MFEEADALTAMVLPAMAPVGMSAVIQKNLVSLPMAVLNAEKVCDPGPAGLL